MEHPQETAGAVVTYVIGIIAMCLHWILDNGTGLFTTLTAIGGFIVVCLRIRYEWKRRDK